MQQSEMLKDETNYVNAPISRQVVVFLSGFDQRTTLLQFPFKAQHRRRELNCIMFNNSSVQNMDWCARGALLLHTMRSFQVRKG
jgi:hypothetical protein